MLLLNSYMLNRAYGDEKLFWLQRVHRKSPDHNCFTTSYFLSIYNYKLLLTLMKVDYMANTSPSNVHKKS